MKSYDVFVNNIDSNFKAGEREREREGGERGKRE
jgi:hypothetical protein